VVGEAGVGKSRLLGEFSARSRGQGWHLLGSEALPGGELVSYGPIVQLLRARFELYERAGVASTQEAVAAWIRDQRDAALEPALPALLSVLDVPTDDPGWSALDVSIRRQRILDAVADVLVRESLARPALVVCENLHWIDPESQACLDALVGRLARAGVLLVVSHRPEYTPPWGSLPYYNPLRLDALSSEAAEELLGALLGGDPRLAPVTSVLIEHTAGNPLFLEECARALAETGVLAEASAAQSAAPVSEITGLVTVHAVLGARMRRLSPEDQRLLALASVIGVKIPVAVLEAVTELAPEALQDSVARLAAAEFLHETGPFAGVELSFRQTLKHEVAYSSMSADERRAAHAHCLGALEGFGADHPAARPDVLGDHAFRGEIWDKAAGYLRRAGARAAARGANGEAVARLEQAVAAAARLPESRETVETAIDLRLDLRPPLLQLGRLPDVLEVSQQAEALAQRIGDEARLARVYTYLANYHYLKGEHETAVEYGDRCAAIGQARGDTALVALARAYMGYSLHAQGRCRVAERVLRENLAALDALPPGEVSMQTAVSRVGSAAWLAFALADLGDFDEAERFAATAQELAEPGKNPYSQAIAATMAGLVWLGRGHLERALPLLERSLAACRDKHLVVWQPVPSALLGVALARGGRADRAVALLQEGVTRTTALGVNAYLARWTAHQAEGLLAAGQTEPAREAAERARELAVAHREQAHEAEALLVLGEAAAEPEAAVARLREALALTESLDLQPLAARCHLALGGLVAAPRDRLIHLIAAIDLGRTMELGLWLDRAVAALRRLGHLFVLPRPRTALQAFLAERWAADPEVRVILERRQGPRTRGTTPAGVVLVDA
jgi:tetratricopeptide (TPR) repeat protein